MGERTFCLWSLEVTVLVTKATEQIFSNMSGKKQTIHCGHGVCGSEFSPDAGGPAGVCSMRSEVSAGKPEGWEPESPAPSSFTGLGLMA